MPLNTRLKKSGVKKVYDQSTEGNSSRLDQAGRQIWGGTHPEITPGPAGLKEPLRNQQTSQTEQRLQAVRRRKLASRNKVS